jgi:thiamine phosphate synthase YjbQ (UPF0047 family)
MNKTQQQRQGQRIRLNNRHLDGCRGSLSLGSLVSSSFLCLLVVGVVMMPVPPVDAFTPATATTKPSTAAYYTIHKRARGMTPWRLFDDDDNASVGGGTNGNNAFLLQASRSSSSSSSTNVVDSQQQSQQLGRPICIYVELEIPSSKPPDVKPQQEVSIEDLTIRIQELIQQHNLQEGTITVISKHTTTSIMINEYESRLAQDVADVFLKLIPPDERFVSTQRQTGVKYKHNDIHLRPDSLAERQRCIDNGWDVDNDPDQLQKWRAQEPVNAHSHLIAMMLGSSECIPVTAGKMVLGQWQSIMLVDLDGPRTRKVGIQLMGYTSTTTTS